MGAWTIRVLRLVLAGLLLGLVAVQAGVLPALARDLEEVPELASARWLVAGLCIAGLVAVEVVLVCVWRLLTLVRRDAVFSVAAFRWVDAVAWASLAAAACAFVLGLVLAPGDVAPPGFVLIVGLAGAGALAVALVVVVLRLLLAKAVALDATATTLRAELDEVI
ncbi:DUF2975 domain-containing protein [Cellulomonas massiliensis]|uniref:DUF2975 domain-containing protein n=1 Tax=Cellulomonas massiliensis TaxID=1465811 RepID=UPI000317234E|nr:DUF2975 domain-containing protein [Cellulomonas massiliensis]